MDELTDAECRTMPCPDAPFDSLADLLCLDLLSGEMPLIDLTPLERYRVRKDGPCWEKGRDA